MHTCMHINRCTVIYVVLLCSWYTGGLRPGIHTRNHIQPTDQTVVWPEKCLEIITGQCIRTPEKFLVLKSICQKVSVLYIGGNACTIYIH